ncbi:hypothetical protein GCM10007159_07210 [Modicisalibacter luteus]|nr:hypothetical protein GCM10007159_07210 [Halomonas lutea]
MEPCCASERAGECHAGIHPGADGKHPSAGGNTVESVESIRLSIPGVKGAITIEWPVDDAQGCRALLRNLLS